MASPVCAAAALVAKSTANTDTASDTRRPRWDCDIRLEASFEFINMGDPDFDREPLSDRTLFGKRDQNAIFIPPVPP
jgi:hypothetical protein